MSYASEKIHPWPIRTIYTSKPIPSQYSFANWYWMLDVFFILYSAFCCFFSKQRHGDKTPAISMAHPNPSEVCLGLLPCSYPGTQEVRTHRHLGQNWVTYWGKHGDQDPWAMGTKLLLGYHQLYRLCAFWVCVMERYFFLMCFFLFSSLALWLLWLLWVCGVCGFTMLYLSIYLSIYVSMYLCI